MKKASRHHTKQINKRLILREIYEQEQLSRAEIARRTNLTRPTVSTIVAELITDNLVEENGIGRSSGGKRPVLLTVPNVAFQLICVDISNQQYRAAIVDLRGQLHETVQSDKTNLTGEAAVEELVYLIDQLRARLTRPLLGISICSPGLVDGIHGIVRQSNHLNWHETPLRDRLFARYKTPVYLVNDAHAAALAEIMSDAGGVRQNLVLIKIGLGVGAGIIWQGEIVHGDGYGSGEIGQLFVHDRSGQPHKLEQLVSLPAILARARQLVSAEISWEQISVSAAAETIIADVGHHLGAAVATLIGVLNIEQIVLHGPLDQFGEPLLSAIRQTARRSTLPSIIDKTEIRYSAMGADAVLVGCAGLLLKQELGLI